MAAFRSHPSRSLADELAFIAKEAGFAAAGIAAAPEHGSVEGREEARRYEEWIAKGSAGGMEYLKRRDSEGRLLRSSLRTAMPWARSVIVCAANYNTAQPRSVEAAAPGSGWIARYAWTARREADGSLRPSDYHKVLLRRLQAVEARLQASHGLFESRCYVDTGPIVERVYARYAGLGWIGKNTCLLNQQLGSWLFLGVIVTSLPLPEESLTVADRCGSCRRCIEACPTGALTAPYQMDARLCISYLTIEHRGPIPVELREPMGRQVFGCDICQDVCPWNRKPPLANDQQLQACIELVNPALDWLASLDEEGFARAFDGSPVRRARFSGLRRNVAIAMGNSGLDRFLPKLVEWARAEDPVLAEAAQWSIAAIKRKSAACSTTEAAPR